MADITDERLREIASIAADRARAEVIERLRAERDATRAQLQADDQRAWETLGKPAGTYETTNVQRLCEQVERLRVITDDRARGMEAELLAARAEVERLREQVYCRSCGGTVGDHLAPDQGGCPGRFVLDGVEMVPEKHKETNQ